MEFCGGDDAERGCGFAVFFVEELVGEVVGAAEEEVGGEGAEFADVDGSGSVLAWGEEWEWEMEGREKRG